MDLSNYSRHNSYDYIPLDVEEGKKYTFYCDNILKGTYEINLMFGRLTETSITKVANLSGSTTEIGERCFSFTSTGDEVLYSYSPYWLNQDELNAIYNDHVKNVMLVEGTYMLNTMPDYEPYGKYKLPIKVAGKNMFDVSKLQTAGLNSNCGISYPAPGLVKVRRSATAASLGVTVTLPLKAGKYTIKADYDSITGYTPTNNYILFIYDTTICDNGIRYANRGLSKYITLTEDMDVKISFYANEATDDRAVGNECVFKIMLCEGNEDLEWEPGPVTTNIFIDEPLRKVGDYVDYIDFREKKIVRRIGHFDSYNVYQKYNASIVNSVRFMVYDSTLLPSKLGIKEVLCDFLPYNGGYHFDGETVLKNDAWKNHYYPSFSKERLGITASDTNEQMMQKARDYIDTITHKNLYYPLESSIEEIVDFPELSIFDSAIKVEVDTEIQPSKFIINYEYEGTILDEKEI